MAGILQEKFQVDNPRSAADDAHGGWAKHGSARTKKGLNAPRGTTPTPPGMNIANQVRTDQNAMPLVMSGESDVTKDNNPESRRQGFTRLEMRATDDEYSNAHADAFYDEMSVDGKVGFVERNNVLDRL